MNKKSTKDGTSGIWIAIFSLGLLLIAAISFIVLYIRT